MILNNIQKILTIDPTYCIIYYCSTIIKDSKYNNYNIYNNNYNDISLQDIEEPTAELVA